VEVIESSTTHVKLTCVEIESGKGYLPGCPYSTDEPVCSLEHDMSPADFASVVPKILRDAECYRQKHRVGQTTARPQQ
jgi:hypothetical protein